jgi:hypothetical protein
MTTPRPEPAEGGVSDALIRSTIRRLVKARGPAKTICPSEVARALRPGNWCPRMVRVLDVASRLSTAGRIQIEQQGQPVSVDAASGPIRLRWTPDA